MTDQVLRTETLSAGYDGQAVLSDVTVSVLPGEILALIGPNGAGKSTLLKTVAGLLPPVAGEIFVCGTALRDMDRKVLARTLAVLTTERIHAERMTCEDVVATGRHPYTGRLGILSEQDRTAVSEAMKLVHAKTLAGRLFSQISDGQRQRVMLARAISQDAKLFVMDEPASFLDINYKISFFSLLKQLAKDRNIAVVLSLHEVELAPHVCNKVLCVRDGKADRIGKPEDVLTEAYIEQLFGMEPGAYRTFFRAEKRPDAGQPADGLQGGDDIRYVRSGTEKLRRGFTTGTCAALAAAGAAKALLTGEIQDRMRLVTPAGIPVDVGLLQQTVNGDTATCAVKKDSGDDPDVTNGCLVVATVKKIPAGIEIDGGEGVGRITKPGLDRAVGEAAINAGPRRMMTDALDAIAGETEYTGGFSVVISVPDGAAIAAKTFNPMLGVSGGISILGTSGIVEPMSEQALIDTIAVEIRQAAAAGFDRLILTPGNYGEDYIREHGLDKTGLPVVRCSNFIGEALDIACTECMKEVLIVGHIGKLVKLAGGIMQTHSAQADCRTDLFVSHAALQGVATETCRKLYHCVTTDACIAVLDEAGMRDAVLQSLLRAIDAHLSHRAKGRYESGAVLFSNRYGTLGKTDTALRILERTAHSMPDAVPFGDQ